MTDIRSALEKALAQTANAWAADDEAHQQIQPQQEKTVPTTTTATPEKKDGRITTNVSRATFNFVRDNPGLTIEQVTALLKAQGFNDNSVSALCYQMIRVRLIVADANGKLSAVVKEYVPIPSSMVRKKRTKPKAVVEATPAPAKPERKQITIINTRTGEIVNPKPAAGIAALPNQTATTAVYTPQEQWSPSDVIDKLNVRQAMAVYDELRKIFGG
jgi:hypothetical protein